MCNVKCIMAAVAAHAGIAHMWQIEESEDRDHMCSGVTFGAWSPQELSLTLGF